MPSNGPAPPGPKPNPSPAPPPRRFSAGSDGVIVIHVAPLASAAEEMPPGRMRDLLRRMAAIVDSPGRPSDRLETK